MHSSNCLPIMHRFRQITRRFIGSRTGPLTGSGFWLDNRRKVFLSLQNLLGGASNSSDELAIPILWGSVDPRFYLEISIIGYLSMSLFKLVSLGLDLLAILDALVLCKLLYLIVCI